MMPEHLRPFYFLNPIAGILEAHPAVFFVQSVQGSHVTISGVTGLAIFFQVFIFSGLSFGSQLLQM